MRLFIFFVVFLVCLNISAFEKIKIGPFDSRAILHNSKSNNQKAILMLPGSGPQGPEEMIPANLSSNNKDVSLFDQFSKPFVEEEFVVLQLGKPGVEFFKGWNPSDMYYDVDLLKKTVWNDLLKNARSAIHYLKHNLKIKEQDITILGHSEGTQLAVDLAGQYNLSGVILLGYLGSNYLDLVRWQYFEREIEYIFKSDVDINNDGIITKEEVSKIEGLNLDFSNGKNQYTLNELRELYKRSYSPIVNSVENSKFCSDGHCKRKAMYEETAKLSETIYAMTGELDLQTRAEEALKLKVECEKVKKKNCFIDIISGVQHGFNLPKPPRAHPMMDIAVAPAEKVFLKKLKDLAIKIKN